MSSWKPLIIKDNMLFRIGRIRSRFSVRGVLAVVILTCILVAVACLSINVGCEFPDPPQASFPDDEDTCIAKYVLTKYQNEDIINSHFDIPSCDNLVDNMVNGKWVKNSNYQETELNSLYDRFMSYHEGFSTRPFRNDGKCGYKVYYDTKLRCAMFYFDSSAWCDPDGPTPCCSDLNKGECVPANKCLATQDSVDLSQFKYAEISNWKSENAGCNIVEYNQKSACSLIHQKKIKSIGFVGNSHMRNFYSLMIQLLTNNFYNGTIKTCVPPSIREKCVNQWQNIDKYCLALGMGFSSLDLHQPICNGQLDTHVYFRDCYLTQYGYQLNEHIATLKNVENSYLFVGIGVHDKFNAKLVFEKYLKPAVDAKKGSLWPKIIWVHAPKPGIFKPVGYTRMHGDYYTYKNFVTDMHKYCKQNNILALDISSLTSDVWSIDGQHYTSGVNLMKVQFILNLIAADVI